MRGTVTTFLGVSVFAAALSAQGIATKDLTDGLANPGRWLTYSGDYTGQRFSPLTVRLKL